MTKFGLPYIGNDREERSSALSIPCTESQTDDFLWISLVHGKMTWLPKCMQNLIPTENIQGVRYINTFQSHPIS